MSKIVEYAVGTAIVLIVLGYLVLPAIDSMDSSVTYSNGTGDWQSLDMADDHVISFTKSTDWTMSVDGGNPTVLQASDVAIYSDTMAVYISSASKLTYLYGSGGLGSSTLDDADIYYDASTQSVEIEISGNEAVDLTTVSVLIVPGQGDYVSVTEGYVTDSTVIYAVSPYYTAWVVGTPSALNIYGYSSPSVEYATSISISDYDSNGVATADNLLIKKGSIGAYYSFLVPDEIKFGESPTYMPILLILPILIILAVVVWGIRVISVRDDRRYPTASPLRCFCPFSCWPSASKCAAGPWFSSPASAGLFPALRSIRNSRIPSPWPS